MNEKIDFVEGLDFVDLGNATEETKQIAPAVASPDSTYGWGWPAREPL